MYANTLAHTKANIHACDLYSYAPFRSLKHQQPAKVQYYTRIYTKTAVVVGSPLQIYMVPAGGEAASPLQLFDLGLNWTGCVFLSMKEGSACVVEAVDGSTLSCIGFVRVPHFDLSI